MDKCNCDNCEATAHDSDCAVHNEPAMRNGPCDCSTRGNGMNLVELCASDEEQEKAPCKHGNVVAGHACYCHHSDGPRKCPQWRNAEPYEDCKLFEAAAQPPVK